MTDELSDGPGSIHTPVLLHEVVEALMGTTRLGQWKIESIDTMTRIKDDEVVYLDGTLGGAGHALGVAKALHGNLTIIGLDNDTEAIERAQKVLEGKAKKVILEDKNFRTLDEVLDTHQIPMIDLMLLDLGLSSDELEHSGKGFTFLKDEPLLMTMGDPKEYPFTAATIVNTWDEETIANIIFGYGEEKYARRIAKAIVAYREKTEIKTTTELAEIVKGTVSFAYRRSKIHPATRTFQALRIAVNDELSALKEGLAKGYERLSDGGRMVIISFHSLEDRIVKEFMKAKATEHGDIVSRKPIGPDDQEIAENPRSRSAKLRILQKQ